MTQAWGLILATPEGATLHLVTDGVVRTDHANVAQAISAAGLARDRLLVPARAAAAPPARVVPEPVSQLSGLLQDSPMAWLSVAQRITLVGVIEGRGNWDGVICLVQEDTTDWVHVSAGEIISFQGAATGRLMAALGGDRAVCDPGALGDSLSRPERLAAHLQSDLLAGNPAMVTARLIGAELAAMRPYWLGQEVFVVQDGALYADALKAQGVMVTQFDPDKAWRDGLRAVGRKAGLAA